jgi:hypothetical protein
LHSRNGALANVTLDGALRGNVASVFRQSLKDSERRPSPNHRFDTRSGMQSRTQVLITGSQANNTEIYEDNQT